MASQAGHQNELQHPLVLSTGDSLRTVIVGAGVIGLSIAYNLAELNARSNRSESIIIIDAFEDTFGAASSANSGCLLPSELQPDLQELAYYSYDLYKDLANDEDFASTTGFRQQALFALSPGAGKGLEALPDWVVARTDWDASLEPSDGASGAIHPKRLGHWLKRRCEELGVEIMTSTTLKAIHLDASDQMDSITVSAASGIEHISAQHVVLAAGPWTPHLLSKLLPTSPLCLGFSQALAGDYVIVRRPTPMDQDSIAGVFFDDIVKHKLEMIGRNDGTIWITAESNTSATLPTTVGIQDPTPDKIAELLDYSVEFISGAQLTTRPALVDVVEQGRSFRPMTASGLPVMASVKRSQLGDQHARYEEATDGPAGLYICSGHGYYGILLGLGSGRAMSRLITGLDAEIDMARFDFPAP